MLPAFVLTHQHQFEDAFTLRLYVDLQSVGGLKVESIGREGIEIAVEPYFCATKSVKIAGRLIISCQTQTVVKQVRFAIDDCVRRDEPLRDMAPLLECVKAKISSHVLLRDGRWHRQC